MDINGLGPTPLEQRFIQPFPPLAGESEKPRVEAESFKNVLSGLVDNTDVSLKESDKTVQKFVNGQLSNPHELFIRMEEAHLQLQFTVALRNKVVDAYNEVMRMQI